MHDLPAPIVIDLPASELPAATNWLGQIHHRELDGVVLRGLFDPKAATDLADALHGLMDDTPADIPLLKLAGQNKRNAVSVMGHPALPTSHHPGGPPLDWYLAHSARVREVYLQLAGDRLPFSETLERLLPTLYGGRPVTLAHSPDGQPFGRASLRGFAEEQGFVPHAEGMHVGGPVIETVADVIDLENLFSSFAVLSRPEGGGELVIYQGAWDGSRGRSDQLPDDLPDYPHQVLTLNPGDFILFGAGRMVHEVRPVEGKRMRWTVGAFGAFSHQEDMALYWA